MMASPALPPRLRPQFASSQASICSVDSSRSSVSSAGATVTLRHELDAVLASPVWRRAFSRFLAREHCSENLLFLRAVDCFHESFSPESLSAVPAHVLAATSHSRAQYILLQFLEAGSANEINLPSKQRNVAVAAIRAALQSGKAVPADVFDHSYEHIVEMLAQDQLRKFKKSDLYTKAAASATNPVLPSLSNLTHSSSRSSLSSLQ
ncbi:RGS domain-containing protein [Entophlyctis helioformis]|nr:RGS domain-containing protein [Entophlyctis helioformis]